MIRPRTGRDHGALIFTMLVAVTLAFVATRVSPVETRAPRTLAEPTATTTELSEVVAPLPQELHAVWTNETRPDPFALGEVRRLTVVLRNTGSAAWVAGSPAEVRLGTIGDDTSFADRGMAVGWRFPTRPAFQDEPRVAAGEIGTFHFKVRASSPGYFALRLRPVVDGVAWFDEPDIKLEISVLVEQ